MTHLPLYFDVVILARECLANWLVARVPAKNVVSLFARIAHLMETKGHQESIAPKKATCASFVSKKRKVVSKCRWNEEYRLRSRRDGTTDESTTSLQMIPV